MSWVGIKISRRGIRPSQWIQGSSVISNPRMANAYLRIWAMYRDPDISRTWTNTLHQEIRSFAHPPDREIVSKFAPRFFSPSHPGIAIRCAFCPPRPPRRAPKQSGDPTNYTKQRCNSLLRSTSGLGSCVRSPTPLGAAFWWGRISPSEMPSSTKSVSTRPAHTSRECTSRAVHNAGCLLSFGAAQIAWRILPSCSFQPFQPAMHLLAMRPRWEARHLLLCLRF